MYNDRSCTADDDHREKFERCVGATHFRRDDACVMRQKQTAHSRICGTDCEDAKFQPDHVDASYGCRQFVAMYQFEHTRRTPADHYRHAGHGNGEYGHRENVPAALTKRERRSEDEA